MCLFAVAMLSLYCPKHGFLQFWSRAGLLSAFQPFHMCLIRDDEHIYNSGFEAFACKSDSWGNSDSFR